MKLSRNVVEWTCSFQRISRRLYLNRSWSSYASIPQQKHMGWERYANCNPCCKLSWVKNWAEIWNLCFESFFASIWCEIGKGFMSKKNKLFEWYWGKVFLCKGRYWFRSSCVVYCNLMYFYLCIVALQANCIWLQSNSMNSRVVFSTLRLTEDTTFMYCYDSFANIASSSRTDQSWYNQSSHIDCSSIWQIASFTFSLHLYNTVCSGTFYLLFYKAQLVDSLTYN